MPCTEHQKNVWEHRKGFYKQFFHWYGWASTTKPITFFRQTFRASKKNRVQKEGQRSPSEAKVGYFLKKKCFL